MLKVALSNITNQQRKVMISLSKDQNTTTVSYILTKEAAQWSLIQQTTIPGSTHYSVKTKTNETVRGDPTSGHKKKTWNVYNSYRKKKSSYVNNITVCILEKPFHKYMDYLRYAYQQH